MAIKSWMVALAALVVVAAFAVLFFARKEKYTAQTMFLDKPRLDPVLRGPNSETMDVLAYSLGGLVAPKQKKC
jgi:uncharacterized protein involved in exopolysaccharide biosynthesis